MFLQKNRFLLQNISSSSSNLQIKVQSCGLFQKVLFLFLFTRKTEQLYVCFANQIFHSSFRFFFLKRCKNADTSYPELQRLHCEVPLPSFRSIIYYLPCKPRLILHKSLQAKGQNHTTSTSGRRSSPRRSKKGCGASQVIGKMQQLRQDLD